MTPGKPIIIEAKDLQAFGSLRPDPAELELTLEWVDVDSLKLFPGNARVGDPDRIAESIDENGFFDPLTVARETRYIITGNHTYLGAKARGMTRVPVIFVDVDHDRAVKMNLVHNKLSDDADYDLDALLDQLTGIEDLAGTGWTEDELAQLTADDDEDPEEEPVEDLGIDGLGVVIMAQNQQHQMQIIDDLQSQGYTATPTTVKNTVKMKEDY